MTRAKKNSRVRPPSFDLKKKIIFNSNVAMPLSYVVYGSVSLVVITLLLFIFTKKKNR